LIVTNRGDANVMCMMAINEIFFYYLTWFNLVSNLPILGVLFLLPRKEQPSSLLVMSQLLLRLLWVASIVL